MIDGALSAGGGPSVGIAFIGQMPAYFVRLAQEADMDTAMQAYKFVGGGKVFGVESLHGLDLVRAVRRGFPADAVQYVLDSGRLTLAEVDRVVMPRKTWSNRRQVGTLTAEQSDRLIRVARVLAIAEETFVNPDKARIWLRRPTDILDGERPLDLLDTEEGAREVETLLGRIAHGIAA
jgi:putative toxin-antitoxin system antitoxin component (TIGR02293 family)